MNPKLNSRWPVLTSYDKSYLACISLPAGGIGTGTVSVGGRGNLQDWEIMNRPAKSFPEQSSWSFFALYAKAAGKPAVVRTLEGSILPPYEGPSGSTAGFAGLPRFRKCEFHTAYPFGQVLLSDPDVPLQVRMETFNPFVPSDPDDSGIPVVILRYVLVNPSSCPVTASVCGNILNFIGTTGKSGKALKNRNVFRRTENLKGLFMYSKGVDRRSAYWGTMALATDAKDVTYKLNWSSSVWQQNPLMDFWEDFSDGILENRKCTCPDAPMGSLAVSVKVPPRSEKSATFLLTWHFPNRPVWHCARKEPEWIIEKDISVGNYYTTRYRDAWDVAEKTSRRLDELEKKTLVFVSSFCRSSLPSKIKEAGLYNLTILRSQTCFRTADGYFFGWEGCGSDWGCCQGSCTHVWNYEQATPFLFGSLAMKMRDVEFGHSVLPNGLMAFRADLPLRTIRKFRFAAADGQMGCIMKMYRDWQLSGDDNTLKKIWPSVKKSLEFCWIKGGWDADKDGVMEGCQHNTADVEYFGPNPLMGTWYLGALRAAEEMSLYLGERSFAAKCRELFERGSAWIDKHLFNGEYYEQEIRPVKRGQKIAKGLLVSAGKKKLSAPDFQLGAGCMADQLVGQYLAHICGLGYLLDPVHVRKTLQSIMKYNFMKDFSGYFNHMRTYILNDEPGMLVVSYPKGRRPERPTPYFSEVWTGLEYTAAAHMIYAGMEREGLRVVSAARSRYDGKRRNPFNEAECGYHYARAMASWASVLAWSGFHYSAVDKTMSFAAKPGKHFWSNGYSWGTCIISRKGNKFSAELSVLYGALKLRQFVLAGIGQKELTGGVIHAGNSIKIVV